VTGLAKRLRGALWPKGLTSRVALVLMICLFVIQAVSIAIYVGDRARATTRIFASSVAQRIVSIVDLMERTPPGEREAILPSIESPTLWIELAPDGPPELEPPWRRAPRAEAHIRDHLRALAPRPIVVRVLGGWRDSRRHRHWHQRPEDLAVPDLLPSRRKLAILVGLDDGGWLAFTVSADTTSLKWAVKMGFWIALSGGFILLFAIWAARRVARPLRRFAEAADRLGVDVDAPPLEESGPSELRQATRAFNRMQERLRRFVEDRTLLLAAISHDLRTALTRLKLRAEFIEDVEQQRKALADLDEMQAMLDATLSFARDDAAKEPRSRVDLAALLQSLCDDLADAGQPVTYAGPDSLTFDGRPLALRRAFSNLIGNAVAYGGEAEVALAPAGQGAGEGAGEGPDGGAVVTVGDRGPGIPEDMREKVFDPFFRLDPSRSRETGGTGLGLAVARGAIRRHGGDISLEDRPGGGLLVRVTLPGA
jgi:signal transduction histidine kinase